MLKNLFKTKPTTESITQTMLSHPEVAGKILLQDVPKINIIEQIHNEFETASTSLLKEAREILAKEITANLSKAERLAKIGFHSTTDVKESNKVIKERTNAEKNADLVLYYAETYPDYKFITWNNVKSIAKKYDLILGDAKDFIGFMPERNLTDIENFNKEYVLDKDREYISFGMYIDRRKATYEEFLQHTDHVGHYMQLSQDFRIVAPEKDFDTRGKRIVDRELVAIPDPVVLFPIRDGALIITAWGDEANDYLVKK